MSATALPMSWPYFHTVSPDLMSTSAILWPIGTSILDVRPNDELSAVTTHSMSVPALSSSITTTPTVSFLSCTSRCGAAIILAYVSSPWVRSDKGYPTSDQASSLTACNKLPYTAVVGGTEQRPISNGACRPCHRGGCACDGGWDRWSSCW